MARPDDSQQDDVALNGLYFDVRRPYAPVGDELPLDFCLQGRVVDFVAVRRKSLWQQVGRDRFYLPGLPGESDGACLLFRRVNLTHEVDMTVVGERRDVKKPDLLVLEEFRGDRGFDGLVVGPGSNLSLIDGNLVRGCHRAAAAQERCCQHDEREKRGSVKDVVCHGRVPAARGMSYALPVLVVGGDVDFVGVEVAQQFAGDDLIAQRTDLLFVNGEGIF